MTNIVQFPQDEKRRIVLRVVQVMEWQTESRAMRFYRKALASYRRQLEREGYDANRIDDHVYSVADQIDKELSARANVGALLAYDYAMNGAA
jgi:hypothetical protein